MTAGAVGAKGIRTRQSLIDAAVAHFAAIGLQKGSVPAIARDVGISPSAVYSYFPSKQALFEAAIDADVAGLLVDAVPDLLAGTFDWNFARLFQRLRHALPAHPLARRVLSGDESDGIARVVVLPSEVRLQTGIQTALRRGQQDGTVRSDIDIEKIAHGLEAIVVALLIAILQSGEVIDRATSEGVLEVLNALVRPCSDRPLGLN